jgi:hypothetical protein
MQAIACVTAKNMLALYILVGVLLLEFVGYLRCPNILKIKAVREAILRDQNVLSRISGEACTGYYLHVFFSGHKNHQFSLCI